MMWTPRHNPARPCDPAAAPPAGSRLMRWWSSRWIELFAVAVVVTVLAFLAGPRLSRAAERADYAAVYGDAAVLRNAVQMYAADHGGSLPAPANFDRHLTCYSDAAGERFSDTYTADTPLGPYLRRVPAVRVGAYAGSAQVAAVSGEPSAPWDGGTDGGGPDDRAGWLMDVHTGRVWPNAWGFLPARADEDAAP